MVFLKYKLINKNIYNKSFNSKDIITQGVVIGIYDYIFIRKLDEEFEFNGIDFKYKNFEEIKYYELKHSIMKIMDDVKGNGSDDNYISAIIQIEVPKQNLDSNENKKEIYEDLTRDLKKVKDIFKNKRKSKFKNIEFFKSLGPKDIIIHIDCSNIDFIFEIKKELAIEFKRTFTTLYIDRKKEKLLKSSNKYIFVTKLRMNQDYKYKDYINLLNNNIKNIEKIELITGSMDYVITWKENISFDTLMKFYNELLGENNSTLVDDIQTSIAKKIVPQEEIKNINKCQRIK